MHLNQPAPLDFPARSSGATAELRGPDTLEVFVPEDIPLAPILAEIGERLAVRDIESQVVTLHDVYVQSIASHNASTQP